MTNAPFLPEKWPNHLDDDEWFHTAGKPSVVDEPGDSENTPTEQIPVTTDAEEQETVARNEQNGLKAEEIGRDISEIKQRIAFRKNLGKITVQRVANQKKVKLPERIPPATRSQQRQERKVARRVADSALRREVSKSKAEISGPNRRGVHSPVRTFLRRRSIKGEIGQLHKIGAIDAHEALHRTESLLAQNVTKERLGDRINGWKDQRADRRPMRSAHQPIRSRIDNRRLVSKQSKLAEISALLPQQELAVQQETTAPEIAPTAPTVQIPVFIHEKGELFPGKKDLADPSKVLELAEAINRQLAIKLSTRKDLKTLTPLDMARLKVPIVKQELARYLGVPEENLTNPEYRRVPSTTYNKVLDMLRMPIDKLREIVDSQ